MLQTIDENAFSTQKQAYWGDVSGLTRKTFLVLLMLFIGQLQAPSMLSAQNTPLATPAMQNADGTTNVPGTPAACAAGSSIYTIDHEDATIGFLPGGFCVTTNLLNTGTTSINVTGTPNGAGIGDVDNIVVSGGRINYSSTDGGNLDATYEFCSTVTNPYVFIGDLETFTTINFFDCSGNPVNVNLMNGQNRFAVSGNSALITGTTSTNQDGYVQVPGTYDCLVININNPAPFTLDVIQISIGVCMPDPPSGNMVCPYDLFLWKKDEFCLPIYRDAEGIFYEKDQNNNNIASLGDGLFTNTPICGTLELLEADCAIDDNACEPEFSCDAFPVEIQYYEPAGTGCLYSTYWYDQTSFSINDTDPGNQWSAVFSGTDANGLPAHPGTPTNAAENCGLEWLGDNEGDIDFDDEAGGANEDEQLQLDGWLYVANHLECIQFRIGSSATDHSVALYAGADLGSMSLVTEENDEQAGFGNNTNGVTGSFCIPDNAATTVDDCAWRLIRVRIYAHDDDTAYDPAVDWSFNGGLTWDVVEEQWFTAATSANDNTPPVGTGVGGCNPVTNCLIDADEVLVDETGKIWPAGNCTSAPNNLYEPNIPNGGSCFGDANAEEGDHLSLIPYCIVYDDEPSFTCNICEIDIQVDGCACSNPGNVFSTTCMQDVSQYKQTIVINSETNNSYTFTSATGIVGGIAGITTVDGVGEEQSYCFFVTPGTAYSITVMGDDTNVLQTFDGLCEAPNDCNCPSMPEICGDGIDNDCDGLVDAADSDIIGNCVLDCTPEPVSVEIQGKEALLDGHLTHQVWSRECGNTACCSSSINPHSCALAAFTCVDVNGLPAHNNSCNPIPSDPCNPAPPGGPVGAAGCTGNDVFTLLGSTHGQAPQFYSTRAEQTQLDGWMVVPPGITCFELKVNHPRAWDAQAVYMGEGVASMSLIGASSFPPPYNTTDEGACQADDGSSGQGSDVFNYDVTTDGSTAITIDGCTWHVVRVRAYIFDESWYHVTPVQWNYGEGFQTVPSRFFQSVGPAGWDTDANKPTAANIVDLPPYCAFQDGDGDLFTLSGDYFTFDPQKCEQIMESACLNCPPFFNYQCDDASDCVNFYETDPTTGNAVAVAPECDLQLVEVTKRELDNSNPNNANGLLTRYWDHNDANCVSDQLENESIFCAFSGYDPNSANCPNCLPEHPDFNNPTESGLLVETLGTNTMPFANDVDDDNFRLRALNRESGENIQQDGWLLVPPNVDCIAFRMSSLAWDAGALYLGTDINNMTFVGENVNRNGNNPVDTFFYELPANPQVVTCMDCDNQDFTLLRVRTYHHDNNMLANTIWEWNISGVFKRVPTAYLFPVSDHCADDLPVDICPPFENTTTTTTAVLEDANSNGQYDVGERLFESPWNSCDAAVSNIDIANIPVMTPIVLDGCETVTAQACPICCQLEVMCPPPILPAITCNDAIPPAATDEASFEALGGLIADDPGFCGTLTITSVDEFVPPIDICNGRTMTRTYTISDDNTTILCAQTLTISPPDAPVITCPADANLECTDDTSIAANGMATATADCGLDVNVSLNETSTQVMDGSCAEYQYTITRVWTATDDCGRMDVCTQTINVDDTTPPVTPPAPAPLVLQCANEIPDIFELTATDNCAPDITVFPIDVVTVGNCPSRLSIVRTWTFADPCGNTSAISQNIEVMDDQPIVVQCPPTRTIECASNVIPEPHLVAVDMPCNSGFNIHASDPVLSSNAPNCPGAIYTITYTVSDPCGRTATCSQNFIIENDPPEFVCPNEICYVECDTPPEVLEGHFDEFLTTATVLTSCPMDIKISHDFNASNLSNACGSNNVVTFTATDDCGRSTTCTVLIVIQDSTPPTISGEIPHGKNECDDNLESHFNNWVNNSINNLNVEENCGEVSWEVSPESPLNLCGGFWNLTEITFTATDACGNTASIVGHYYVANRFGASILGDLADITVSCNEEIPEFGEPFIIHTCGDYTLTEEDVTETTECGFAITRTWTVIDGCGKESTRSQTIYVEDTQGPIFNNVPAGGPIECDFYPPSFGPVEVSDDCGDFDLTYEDTFNGNPNGCDLELDFVVTRTWTARDACGNISTASQSFSVRANKNGRGGSIRESSIVITPNPTHGSLRLNFQSDQSTKITVNVFNILGQLMQSSEFSTVSGLNEQMLDLSHLDNATYILSIQSGVEVFTKKLVKINE